MNHKHIAVVMTAAISAIAGACSNSKPDSSTDRLVKDSAMPQTRHLLNRQEQSEITPAEVLAEFKAGNLRYSQTDVTTRYHTKAIREAATGGQFPKAVVISCLDSRVPVEDIFDQGLGDVFVGRVAGNFINDDLLGSLEFACKLAGAKLIIVMGHQHCGAVKGAIDNVQLGHLTDMLANIKPAIAMSADFAGEKSSKNEAYVKEVAKNNVRNAVAKIRAQSQILREMEAKGEIKITGAFYTLRNGVLEFL